MKTLTARARCGLVQLTALAPDLFRFRLTRTARFSARPSWAVCKTEWPDPVATVTQSARRVALKTTHGELRLATNEDAWELLDAAGRSVFQGTCLIKKGRPHVSVELKPGESLFGLGETTGTFNKRGLVRDFWNIDVLGHAPAIHPGMRNLHVSIPMALALHEGRAAGLFWDNPARQRWDLGQTDSEVWWMEVDSGEIDLYLFPGPAVKSVVERYTELTGRMPMPPRWGLGYQQSRYSYKTRERVEEVAAAFRAKKIPCDVIYLDIHYMRGYRVFTIGRTFPKPAEMIAKLRQQGFKTVTILDPGVKDDPKYGVLQRGRKGGHFVKDPRGRKDMIGKVWPEESRFPDFLNARTRAWWGKEQAALQKLGVAGFWNDMNEPAIFDGPGKTLPGACVHQTDHGPLPHASIHNVYAMHMAWASQEGMRAGAPGQRPFVITRAGYAGVQRHALIWTGDNSSVWEHLADSVQMLVNLSLSGVAFCGADAGGFLGSATGELLARWLQLAAFTPFFRNHSDIKSHPQEPWAHGPEVEAICGRYIRMRYELLPYLYGLFVEAHRQGTPIMRPLLWHYQDDPTAVAAGDQFLLGRDLLVAPVLRQGAVARSVYLPRGTWHDFHTGARHEGGQHVLAEAPLDTIPLYVRAGAIIPMAPARQFVGERAEEIITLHVWAGGSGALNWYEDDGETEHHLKGDFSERQIKFRGVGAMSLTLGEAKGQLESQIKRWRVVLHGAGKQRGFEIENRPQKIVVRLGARPTRHP
jgi:alpha-glucosidase